MNELTKIRILVSYDGASFFGWQKQKSDRTIQQTLEQALEKIFSQRVKLLGSGRTDAGVHAFGQVADFHCPDKSKVPKDLCYSINSLCPPEIVVREAWWAPEDFHSISSVKDKTYLYKVSFRERPWPFEKKRSLWLRSGLNLDWLNQASQLLVGKRDFASFQSQGSDATTTVREIYEAFWEPYFWEPHMGEVSRNKKDFALGALFAVRGSGFLKHMVRNIVGTLLDLEKNQPDVAEFEKIIQACDRQKALGTAPSCGLYLKSVTYPQELDNRCVKI